ncbi:MAG: AI-2E family transporter [Filimonas sp.]|nr:AI-2E family transporter [Filimonas sp.]
MNYLDTNKLRQTAFLLLLIALGILLFLELKVFLPAFLGSLTFYMLLHRRMEILVEQKKWKPSLAAAALMILSFLVVLVPIWIFITLITSRVSTVIQNSNQILATLQAAIHKMEAGLHFQILTDQNIQKASGVIANTVPNILGATFNTLTVIIIMYFVLYFMLTNTRAMESWLHEYLPLKEENISWIGRELKKLVISNALGIPLIALLQGVVGLIGYYILGVSDPWFWFLLTCITSMLPIVGAALAYVPLIIMLFMQGPAWKGIFMIVYGFGVIGTVDNVFRFMLQKKMGDVHPIITVFGVIIGVNMFGFIGLVFGPILISMFILLIRIYLNEFSAGRSAKAVKKE